MPAKGVGPIQEIIEVPTTPPLTIIVNGLGGSINAHVALFWRIKAQGGSVKVIGPCGSACTQVLSFIPKDRLCFGERSFLAFHMVRKANVPNVEETRLMINSYPDDVRDWINAKGGHSLMPGLKGYWRLGAKELWKMGHAKCDP